MAQWVLAGLRMKSAGRYYSFTETLFEKRGRLRPACVTLNSWIPQTMEKDVHFNRVLSEAWACRGNGDAAKATSLLNLAADLCDSSDFNSLGRICHIRMHLEADQDNYETAVQFEKMALDHYQKTAENARIAHASRHIADLFLQMNRLESALQYYEMALRHYGQSPQPSKIALANAHRGYALLLERLERRSEARKAWQIAKAHYASLGLKVSMTEANEHLAQL